MPHLNNRHIFPLRSLVPNAITVLAICAGMSAMRFAILGRWEEAVIAIIIAGVLDGLDGRMARLLKGTSKFGAELDSLSDIVSFGVAPAVIMYTWVLKDIKGVGWLLALIYTTTMALRLARFNTMNEDENANKEERRDFFSGIPAPAAAGLAVWPMILYFLTDLEIFRNPVLCIIYIELDSLSDIVSFGVAPAVIMYTWVLKDIKGVGWLLALIYTTTMALRLARFNTMNEDENANKEERRDFFSGIPAPAAAGLAVWPMILYFLTDLEIFRNPVLCIIYMGVIAALTVSNVPTFSFKKLSIKRDYVLFYLIGISIFATLLVTHLWATMSVVGFIYILTIPLAITHHKRRFGSDKPLPPESIDQD